MVWKVNSHPVVFAVLISLTGCSSSTSQPEAKRPPSAERWDYSAKVSRGSAITLVPLPPNEPHNRAVAEELSRELFTKMAADSQSRELLSQLYGGLPVELVNLDGKTTFDTDAVEEAQPKMQGPAVLLMLHFELPGNEQIYDGELAETYGYKWAFSGTFSLGRVIRQEKGSADVPTSADVAFAQLREDDDRELLYIVANDYLLRHSVGWQVMFQGGDLPFRRPCATVTELKADLERRLTALSQGTKDDQ